MGLFVCIVGRCIHCFVFPLRYFLHSGHGNNEQPSRHYIYTICLLSVHGWNQSLPCCSSHPYRPESYSISTPTILSPIDLSFLKQHINRRTRPPCPERSTLLRKPRMTTTAQPSTLYPQRTSSGSYHFHHFKYLKNSRFIPSSSTVSTLGTPRWKCGSPVGYSRSRGTKSRILRVVAISNPGSQN